MQLIKPGYKIEQFPRSLRLIEKAARKCYRSEMSKLKDKEAQFKFIRGIIDKGHESVIEHLVISVDFTFDRGISHELVRHRVASYSQESTRYCDYRRGGVRFIIPCWVNIRPNVYSTYPPGKFFRLEADRIWFENCLKSERDYIELRNRGWTPQQARDVLNTSTATTVLCTMNLREWRHAIKLRALGTTGKPHPQMAEVMKPLAKEFGERLPEIFGDLQGDKK